jgi:hypothetical protein
MCVLVSLTASCKELLEGTTLTKYFRRRWLIISLFLHSRCLWTHSWARMKDECVVTRNHFGNMRALCEALTQICDLRASAQRLARVRLPPCPRASRTVFYRWVLLFQVRRLHRYDLTFLYSSHGLAMTSKFVTADRNSFAGSAILTNEGRFTFIGPVLAAPDTETLSQVF